MRVCKEAECSVICKGSSHQVNSIINFVFMKLRQLPQLSAALSVNSKQGQQVRTSCLHECMSNDMEKQLLLCVVFKHFTQGMGQVKMRLLLSVTVAFCCLQSHSRAQTSWIAFVEVRLFPSDNCLTNTSSPTSPSFSQEGPRSQVQVCNRGRFVLQVLRNK